MRVLDNNKGFIFAIIILIVVFVIGLSAAFFMRSTSEKKFVDIEKYTMQANFLAEAGANHGLSELRERIRTDLKSEVLDTNIATMQTDLTSYYSGGTPLQFLVDYADDGTTQFALNNDEATLSVNTLSLPTDVDGNYDSSQIIITAPANPDSNYPYENPTNPETEVYVFYYNYEVKGVGSSTADSITNINKDISLKGSFHVTVIRDSFTRYALFVDKTTTGPTGNLMWFEDSAEFDGPIHTNDAFNFYGDPYFAYEVTQREATPNEDDARFYNNGVTVLIDDDHNGTIDVPEFDKGFERGVSNIPITGASGAIIENDLKNEALGSMPQPGPNGIYVSVDAGTLDGGIYIRGDVDSLVLSTAADGPIYTITQGATTKTVTVNYTTSQTTVADLEGKSATYSGVPDGNTTNEGIIIYSSGEITSAKGTVEQDTEMTIAASDDLVITGNLTYQDAVGNTIASTSDTMLGIVSCGGDVRLATTCPNNVNVHGIVVAPHGVFTADNYDSSPQRGTATLLGGIISDYYGAVGTSAGTGFTRDHLFDARVLNGQIPPYFHKNAFVTNEEGLNIRPIWKNSAGVTASGGGGQQSEE